MDDKSQQDEPKYIFTVSFTDGNVMTQTHGERLVKTTLNMQDVISLGVQLNKTVSLVLLTHMNNTGRISEVVNKLEGKSK